ncbi:unnamed protein product, partial [Effrenium voratum]
MAADSFALWGASLCWGDEELCSAQRSDVCGAPVACAETLPGERCDQHWLRHGVKGANEPPILSTQDILNHEASVDCAPRAASLRSRKDGCESTGVEAQEPSPNWRADQTNGAEGVSDRSSVSWALPPE